MNRKILFALSLPVVFSFFGCSESNPDNEFTFRNDMESPYAWALAANRPSNVVYFKNAHSGRYVCAMDSANVFGVTFEMRLREIDAGPVKRLIVGGWFNIQQNGSTPELVVDIRDKDGNSKEWISHPCKDQIKGTGEWTWVEMALDMTAKNRNQPDNIIRVYPFNKSGAVALADDLEVRFEK